MDAATILLWLLAPASLYAAWRVYLATLPGLAVTLVLIGGLVCAAGLMVSLTGWARGIPLGCTTGGILVSLVLAKHDAQTYQRSLTSEAFVRRMEEMADEVQGADGSTAPVNDGETERS